MTRGRDTKEQHIRQLKQQAGQAFEQRNWKAAAPLYDELAKLVPDDPAALRRAGEVYRKLGRADQAVTRFAREAALYGRQGFLIKAIAVCKLILELDREHTATQQLLASLYAAQRRLTEAPSTVGKPTRAPGAERARAASAKAAASE